MDIVFIEQLEVSTTIGVLEWEKRIKQKLVIDIEMSSNITAAAATDQISDALDYNAVAERITDFAQSNQFQLVETLAEQCAGIIQQEFSVEWVKIRVSKPKAVANSSSVGVIIERGRTSKETD